MLTMTQSALRTLRTCPEKYRLLYEEGVRPTTDPDALRIGTHFHAAIADPSPVEHIDVAYADIGSLPEEVQEKRTAEYGRLRSMVAAYFTHHEKKKLNYLSQEEGFKIELSDGVYSQGVLDGIVKLDDGRLAVLETKTTADDISPGSDYWRRLRNDVQITRYMLGARAMGYAVETVLYDAVRKPAQSPKNIPSADFITLFEKEQYHGHGVSTATVSQIKHQFAFAKADSPRGVPKIKEPLELFCIRVYETMTSDPDRYFQRIEIPRTNADIEVFQTQMMMDEMELLHRKKHDIWQRNDHACFQFGRCPMFDLCANNYTAGSELLPGFERVDNVHPELPTETEA
jgi:hypothetical protein